MKYEFICYKGCSTCKSALKFLDENNIEYTYREITEDTPTVKEIQTFLNKSNYDLKALFNTRGNSYRSLNLKDTFDDYSELELMTMLSNDGMLMKRPILVGENTVLVGFKKAEYLDIK